MDQLQTRLDALEQQMHTVTRRLRWWRGLAGGLLVLAVLTWALPVGTAQEEASEKDKGQKGLAHRVAALEQLLKHFSREKNEIFITGANLHIVNGLGSTDCFDEQPEPEPIPDCPNGLGNLIVGYNEPRTFAENVRTGSHNVVVGSQHNFSRFGGLVVGNFNTISGDFASVSGGNENTASGEFSSVSGGQSSMAEGDRSSVSGGFGNTASGGSSSVSGGATNTASGFAASVSGGGNLEEGELGNTASGELSSVSGGLGNTASGGSSWVSGGQQNTATGFAAAVSGGTGNTASGWFSWVSGGNENTATGRFSVVSGGQNITQETEFGWSAGSEAEEVVVGNFRSP